MPDDIMTRDDIARVKELVQHMESGNTEEVNRGLDDLIRAREGGLYQELGKLTRELHDALNNFRWDTRISDLAEQDFPDARERLNHVLTMTSKAANTTLNAIEESLPMCDGLEQRATGLHEEWQNFTRKKLDAKAFRSLSARVGAFFKDSAGDMAKMRDHLNEVLMAQDFQDLTGQIIKRVIDLVNEVEDGLVEMIKLSGSTHAQSQQDESCRKKQASIDPEGPPVPGVNDAGIVSGQDEVDDLLSSLGF